MPSGARARGATGRRGLRRVYLAIDSAGHQWADAGGKTVVVADALLAGVSGLESPAPMGFVLDLPARPAVEASSPTVVLDRLQDAGNVGSILRSAAAFGFTQVVALKGTAALWSPKVLRAGMGAHFGLRLVEGVENSRRWMRCGSRCSRPVRTAATGFTGPSCPIPAHG